MIFVDCDIAKILLLAISNKNLIVAIIVLFVEELWNIPENVNYSINGRHSLESTPTVKETNAEVLKFLYSKMKR